MTRTATAARALACLLVIGAALSLGGCFILPIPNPIPLSQRGDDDPNDSDDDAGSDVILDGPDGWRNFDHCTGGPDLDFFWVDGLPYKEVDAAGINPTCGDTWMQEDGDHFLNVTDYDVTIEQLDALRDSLIAGGWQQLAEEYKGDDLYARDYYLGDDHLTRFAIELYRNPTGGGTYTAYMDYLSPATRALFDL